MRPTKDQYFMTLARIAATRATCIRRSVGAVAVDARGYVLSIGYNGVPHGIKHCDNKNTCKGFELPPGQDSCLAVHAEQNMILQCRDPWTIKSVFTTISPCRPCLKLLLNTSCNRIVFLEEHIDPLPKDLWLRAGRKWEKLQYDY
jgi:dCMP deaminase